MVDELTDAPATGNGLPRRGVVVAVVGGAIAAGFVIGAFCGRLWEVPGKTAFWTVSAQPAATLLTGILAFSAAALAFYGVLLSVRRSRAATAAEIKQRREATADEIKQRDNATKSIELWKRFEWVVDHLSQQAAGASAIDEGQATDMIIALRDFAQSCGDHHLFKMLDVFMGGQTDDIAAEVGLGADTPLPVEQNEQH